MFHLLENIKNLKENSPVLGPCPGQSGTHETELNPGDDGDDGGEEQDTGKTRHQVKKHLGIKFMYIIRVLMIENHPKASQSERGASNGHDVLALVELEELDEGLFHLLHLVKGSDIEVSFISCTSNCLCSSAPASPPSLGPETSH